MVDKQQEREGDWLELSDRLAAHSLWRTGNEDSFVKVRLSARIVSGQSQMLTDIERKLVACPLHGLSPDTVPT
jgi:hypothetical protein